MYIYIIPYKLYKHHRSIFDFSYTEIHQILHHDDSASLSHKGVNQLWGWGAWKDADGEWLDISLIYSKLQTCYMYWICMFQYFSRIVILILVYLVCGCYKFLPNGCRCAVTVVKYVSVLQLDWYGSNLQGTFRTHPQIVNRDHHQILQPIVVNHGWLFEDSQQWVGVFEDSQQWVVWC